MIRGELKKHLKLALTVFIVIITIFIICSIIFKYQVEGEEKEELPFKLEKISIVSTADGLRSENNNEFLWSGEILQINDIYIQVVQNKELKQILKNVKIENIEVEKAPEKGYINITRISKNEDTSNNYLNENLSLLEYKAEQSTSLENLVIANNGGTIGLRVMNKGLGNYNSNETEINYDGRILKIENIINAEIKFNLKFDILIEVLDGIRYKTRINLELPIGDIIESGVEISEYKDMNNLVYKRY